MKYLCLLVILFILMAPCFSQEVISPTLPGTNIRDLTKPSTVIDGQDIYPTLPGMDVRDYSRPGLRVERDMIYPTLPGTTFRDFSKQGWKIENNDKPVFPEVRMRVLRIPEDK
jgi:hypothetical protein